MDFEKAWQYEAGINHRFGDNFDNRLIAYYSHIHDYLVIDRKNEISHPTDYWGWNINTVIFWGIEYEFNATIKQLGIFGNYTYKTNEVKEDDPDKLAGFWVELPPKHTINLSFRYSFTDSILLTWDQRYLSRRKSELGYTLDGYTTSDVGVQYSFHHNKTRLLVYANNLFGKNYEQVYGYPMPRQTFGAQLKYTF